jgi:putative Holliday junction resolvase
MPNTLYLGFDFGYKRIGVSVGQSLTKTASPLPTLSANQGVPNWSLIKKMIDQWRPQGLIVGIPRCIDGGALYTTKAAQRFADQLLQRFKLPVHPVDERLSTKEARRQLFEEGGYRQLNKSEIDSIAACVILEQWLHHPE